MRGRLRGRDKDASSELPGVVAPVHRVSHRQQVGVVFVTADGGFRIRYRHQDWPARPLNRVDDHVVLWVTADGEMWEGHAVDRVLRPPLQDLH